MTPLKLLSTTILFFCLATGFALLYQVLSSLPWFTFWQAALTVNLSLCAIITCIRPQFIKALFLKPHKLYWYLPSALIILGSLLLVTASSFWGTATQASLGSISIFSISLIPIGEEIVFRAIIPEGFKKFSNGIWPDYFSVTLFALLHTAPSLIQVQSIEEGLSLSLPFGPLLLGTLCQIVFRLANNLLPAISLHFACNLTVIIFSLGDARFFQWLKIFYH